MQSSGYNGEKVKKLPPSALGHAKTSIQQNQPAGFCVCPLSDWTVIQKLLTQWDGARQR